MLYEFKCKNCNDVKYVDMKMSQIKNSTVTCDNCGNNMSRVFSSNLIVPEHMRADNVSEMSALNSSMKTLPSGKRKVIY